MNEFGATTVGEVGPWRVGVVRDFARSELLDRTFQEGMELVEETAGYLDGSGPRNPNTSTAPPRSATPAKACA